MLYLPKIIRPFFLHLFQKMYINICYILIILGNLQFLDSFIIVEKDPTNISSIYHPERICSVNSTKNDGLNFSNSTLSTKTKFDVGLFVRIYCLFAFLFIYIIFIIAIIFYYYRKKTQNIPLNFLETAV